MSKGRYRILKIIFLIGTVVSGIFLGIAIINFILDIVVLLVFNGGTFPNIVDMQTLSTLVFWIILTVILNLVYKSGKEEKVKVVYVEKNK